MRCGKTQVEDEPRSGRQPSPAVTDENIQAVEDINMVDTFVTNAQDVSYLVECKSTVLHNFHQELEMSKHSWHPSLREEVSGRR